MIENHKIKRRTHSHRVQIVEVLKPLTIPTC